jgi:hypothetical protein
MAEAAPLPAPDIAEFLGVAGELVKLLDRESGLVRALKIAEIAPLQADKARLIQLVAKFLKQSDNGAKLPPAARQKWLAAGQRLVVAAADNERVLRIGRTATERLIGAVVSAVKETRRPTSTYSPRRNGRRLPPINGVALDRKF